MKRFSFLIALGVFLIFELFHWGDLSTTPHDSNYSITTDAIAALDKSGDHFSMTAVPAIDPATMILLGSGLVGLAGIGRKKTPQ
jgi:hypothetical protein